jgi:hypothetical protein
MRNTTFNNLIQKLFAGPLAILLLTPGLAQAQNNFESGTVRFSGSISASTSFGDNYYQFGIGAGYYLADGLELGLDARSWLGGEQNIHEVEPSVTVVLTHFGSLKPYGGLLYRRTFLEGQDDLSAYGGRAGLFLQQSQNLMLRAGVVAIRRQDCDSDIYSDCSEVYPEVSAGFYF